MPVAEVITLSSDDEPSPKPRDRSKTTKLGAPASRKVTAFSWDNHDDVDDLCSTRPSKRPRLSPLATKRDNNTRLPSPKSRHAPSKTPGKLVSASSESPWKPIDDDDPIIFTSSGHVSISGHNTVPDENKPPQGGAPPYDEESDSIIEDPFDFRPDNRAYGGMISTKTANILASLSGNADRRSRSSSSQPHQNREPRPKLRKAIDAGCSQQDAASAIRNARTGSERPKKRQESIPLEDRAARKLKEEEEKLARVQARQDAREKKAQEKEEQQVQKRAEKEQKEKEKQEAAAIASVNKARLDKKETTPEMIVHLPTSIAGESLDVQAREFLRTLNVEVNTYQSRVPNVVKWSRKVKAKWSDDRGQWEPLPNMIIESENHVMCIMKAKDFVARVTGQVDEDLFEHSTALKSLEKNCVPIYLIEGLTEWMQKNRNTQNQAYRAKVLGQTIDTEANSTQPRRRKRQVPEIVDENIIEDALLELQVLHGCLIHHADRKETAEWIATFTQHISTIPYRAQQMSLQTTFCMDSGQVKSGMDKNDTFLKMLQENVRITLPIAQGIAAAYPTVSSLATGFREQGSSMLEDLPIGNGAGAPESRRRVGPAISRRLHGVFTGRDPESNNI